LGGKEHKYFEVAQKEVCKDLSHFETFFQDIVDKGGEGVILRDPTSLLQPGRSPGFLKHKVSDCRLLIYLNALSKKFRDAEARVIGSASKHSWECEL
jgi:ATP-dependent DNA ligase